MNNSLQKKIILVTVAGLVIASYSLLKPYMRTSKGMRNVEYAEEVKKHPLLYFQTMDVNKATASELTAIPQIGDVLAGRIIEYRKQHGIFQSMEELKQVQGIGIKTCKYLKQYLHVSNK